MAVPSNVTDQIYTAQLKIANMVDANVVALQAGALKADWWPSLKATMGVNVVSHLNGIGDNSSSGFLTAYACMNAFIGQFAGGAIDPNAQNPGTTINITNLNYTAFNSARIPFTSQTTISLLDYQNAYYPLYGNNPSIEMVLTQGSDGAQDEGTGAIYTYVIPGDLTSGIASITWSYGSTVSGYVQISGVQPVSGTTTGAGANVQVTYTQAALVYDSVIEQYYLPLVVPAGKTVLAVSVNLVSQTPAFNQSYSPSRLYIGPDNSTQTIIVTIG